MKKYSFEVTSLIVCILSVSLGFLMYSKTVVIKNDTYLAPDYANFIISFSTQEDRTVIGNVIGKLSQNNISNFKAGTARISNTTKSAGSETNYISNLDAHFTAPGQSITYLFYARNIGKYSAYLKTVEFKNTENRSQYKICTANRGTSQELVDNACDKINISIKVRNSLYLNNTRYSKIYNISEHILAVDNSELIEVIISYDGDSTDTADGPFYVTFGDIVLTYKMIDK